MRSFGFGELRPEKSVYVVSSCYVGKGGRINGRVDEMITRGYTKLDE